MIAESERVRPGGPIAVARRVHALHLEGLPARAVTLGVRAGPRARSVRIVTVRLEREVFADPILGEHSRTIPARSARRTQRRTPLQMPFVARARRERSCGNVERNAVRHDAAGPHRLPGRIAHERAVFVLRVVAPLRDEAFRFEPVRQRVAAAQFPLVLHGVIDSAGIGAEDCAPSAERIGVEDDAGHRRSSARRCRELPGRRSLRDREVLHRMTGGVLMVRGEREPRAVVEPVTEERRCLVAGEVLARAVLVEVLAERGGAHAELAVVRPSRANCDRRTDRVAGIDCRERAIQDIDAVDLLRRDHVPARRVEAAEKVGQQVAVHQHQAARRLQRREAASADQRVAVADVALADRDVRNVPERVLRVDEVLHAQVVGGLRRSRRRHVELDALTCRGNGNGIDEPVAGDTLCVRQ